MEHLSQTIYALSLWLLEISLLALKHTSEANLSKSASYDRKMFMKLAPWLLLHQEYSSIAFQ